jgi:hypothetical protein
MDILKIILLVINIFQYLIVLTCIGLLLACNVYLIKRVFGDYIQKQCNDNKTYKCVPFTKWAYAGIIINLYFFSMVTLAMIFGIFNVNEKIDIDMLGKSICFFIMCIMIVAIIGSAFLLQQSKLQCDNSYICYNENDNNDIKIKINKFSVIIGLIINILCIIGFLVIINKSNKIKN